MDEIIKKFIVDNQNRKIGVQIDIDTFEKIENQWPHCPAWE